MARLGTLSMTTRYLSDNEQAACSLGKRVGIADVFGVLAMLPSAVGVLCVITRANLSALSLAVVTVLFLVCTISSLSAMLISFWMRRPALVWSVRLTASAWLGVCAYIGVSFVAQLAGFSGR